MKLSETRVELLAPAGRWDAFNAVIDAGADAVYIGGKRFNMRLHRSDFNFTDEQITEAVRFAHEREVKLYITVNNLLCALLFISWPFLVSGKNIICYLPTRNKALTIVVLCISKNAPICGKCLFHLRLLSLLLSP